MRTEPFDFDCADGRRVAARLDRPEGQVRAWALFAHCFTCGKDNLAAVRISRALAAEGVGTLRIDFAGVDDLRGAAMPADFTVDVGDLVQAAAHMDRHGCAPGLIVGHSLGGAAAIAAAGSIPSVKAVATVAAPFDVAHVLKLLGPEAQALAHGETHQATVGGRSVSVGAGFAADLKGQDQAARLGALKRALLVLHSPLDDIVGIEEASQIWLAAKHPKSFVSLDRADHLLSRPADAAYAARVIAAWASRYLDEMTEAVAEPAADGVVRVAETGAGKFQVRVEAGGATLMADEPVSVGGLASGPTPYELVAAGLGACTVMTLRLYAERKGLALAQAAVEVRHARRAGETPPDLFERTLTLTGELTDEARTRLFEIADKCPVHRTLEAGAGSRRGPGPTPPRRPRPSISRTWRPHVARREECSGFGPALNHGTGRRRVGGHDQRRARAAVAGDMVDLGPRPGQGDADAGGGFVPAIDQLDLGGPDVAQRPRFHHMGGQCGRRRLAARVLEQKGQGHQNHGCAQGGHDPLQHRGPIRRFSRAPGHQTSNRAAAAPREAGKANTTPTAAISDHAWPSVRPNSHSTNRQTRSTRP